jgi:hypothetical protein
MHALQLLHRNQLHLFEHPRTGSMQSARLVITTPVLVLAILTLEPRNLLRSSLPLDARRRLSPDLLIAHGRQVPRRRILRPRLGRAERVYQNFGGAGDEAGSALEDAVVLAVCLSAFFHA